MKNISLTQGFSAVVDDIDFEALNQFKWRYHNGYAVRTVYQYRKAEGTYHYIQVRMHREISQAIKGEVVDHIDRNRLHNWRENLRRCTHQQNTFNRGAFQTKHLKGVHERNDGKWEAYIKLNQHQYHIGTFPTEHLAGLARDLWALDAHGEYADTNFRAVKWLGNNN